MTHDSTNTVRNQKITRSRDDPSEVEDVDTDRTVDEYDVIAKSTLVHLYESSSVFCLRRDPAKTIFGGPIPPHLSYFTPDTWRRIQILCRTMKVRGLDRSIFRRTLRPPWDSLLYLCRIRINMNDKQDLPQDDLELFTSKAGYSQQTLDTVRGCLEEVQPM